MPNLTKRQQQVIYAVIYLQRSKFILRQAIGITLELDPQSGIAPDRRDDVELFVRHTPLNDAELKRLSSKHDWNWPLSSCQGDTLKSSQLTMPSAFA